MIPYFNIFGKQLPSYTVMILIGVFVCGALVCHEAKRRKQDDNDYIIFLLICAVGVLVGGHMLYAVTKFGGIVEFITNFNNYASDFDNFIENMAYIFGGSVFYGGLLGGMAAGIIYGKAKKLDLNEYSDICAPIVPLFHFFGRIGCFLGGCCYGIESSFGFTVHNNPLNPSINDVQRFPVQLLEASLNLILFFVLFYLLRKNKLKGILFAAYLIMYSVIRFFDEFLRGDTYRGFIFGLSTSQFISILVFAGAIAYIIYTKKFKKIKPNIQ